MLKVRKQRSVEYESIKIPTAEEAARKAELAQSIEEDNLHKKVVKSLNLLRHGIATAIEMGTQDGKYTIMVNAKDINYKRKQEIFERLEEELRVLGYVMQQREVNLDWFNKEIHITFRSISENVKGAKQQDKKKKKSTSSRRGNVESASFTTRTPSGAGSVFSNYY